MLDQYNRTINYMRLSITDRCNLHCSYCRPDVTTNVSHDEILRYEELLRVAKAAVELGITRFKITGGEPLMRKGCVDFTAQLKQVQGVDQVTMTTNGTLFAPHAKALAEAGVDCVNFSLDTLNAERYNDLTKGGNLFDVVDSIKKAAKFGLRCKINTVFDANIGMDDLDSLMAFSKQFMIPLRFIEKMPLGKGQFSQQSQSAKRICLLLNSWNLRHYVPYACELGNGPAEYYRSEDGHIVGFIEPIHHKFCSSCNRVRLTSTGQLKTCLYAPPQLDVRALLRGSCNDEELREALRQTIFLKPLEHAFEKQPADFAMNEVGG